MRPCQPEFRQSMPGEFSQTPIYIPKMNGKVTDRVTPLKTSESTFELDGIHGKMP
jgi:hypothetical protein